MRSFKFKHLVAVMCTVLAVLAFAAAVAVLVAPPSSLLCNLGTPAVDEAGPDSLALCEFLGDRPDTNWRVWPHFVLVVEGAPTVVYVDSIPTRDWGANDFVAHSPDTLFIVRE